MGYRYGERHYGEGLYSRWPDWWHGRVCEEERWTVTPCAPPAWEAPPAQSGGWRPVTPELNIWLPVPPPGKPPALLPPEVEINPLRRGWRAA